MDIGTIVGILIAFTMMIWAITAGGPLTIFINLPSMMIVLGGTIGVILVNYPLKDVVGAFSVFKKTLLARDDDMGKIVSQMMTFATRARKGGILSLQDSMDEVDDVFLLKALQMAIDGQEPDDVRAMLQTEMENIAERHRKGAEIFTTIGTIAPAMGMVGTLIGLVQMLEYLEDPTSIGPAMALALLTTFYGAILAYVIFIPMAGKLRTRSDAEILQKTIIAEAMEAILSGLNPRIVEQRLHAYLAPKNRESMFS